MATSDATNKFYCLLPMSKVFQVWPKRIKRSNGTVLTPDMEVTVTTLQHTTTPFYNGAKDEPEESELHLSDAFAAESGALELCVKVYNINYEENKRLLRQCRMLRDYSIFVSRVRANLQQKQSLAQAIHEAIDYCRTHDIMKDFLSEKVKEVYDMVNIEWNMDTAKEVWLEEGIEKGIAMGKVEGKVEGKAEGRMETAVELMKEKFPLEKIAKATKLSMEKLQELGRMNGLL